MIILNAYSNMIIGVFGLGITGMAAIYALLEGGAIVWAWDDDFSKVEQLYKLIDKDGLKCNELILVDGILSGRLILNPDYKQANKILMLVASPGIGSFSDENNHILYKICKEHNIPIKCDVQLLRETCGRARYVGITGTNGKSTITKLIEHILTSARRIVEVGGNIGKAALSLGALDSNGIYVLELSSFQLDLCDKLDLDIAVLSNISPDHTDRYATHEAYVQSKLAIFNNTNSFCIVSANYEITSDIGKKLQQDGKKILYVSKMPSDIAHVSVVEDAIYDAISHPSQIFSFNRPSSILGQHNSENIAFAYTVCKVLGLQAEDIVAGIETFQGLPHRMEVVCKHKSLLFVNDSKGTNTNSTECALDTYDNILWIAGGISKDTGIESISHLFSKIKKAYLIGEAADNFAQILAKYNVPHKISFTLEQAMVDIKNEDHTAGVVLLSPACSSLDQWKNYEERGNTFKNLALSWQL